MRSAALLVAFVPLAAPFSFKWDSQKPLEVPTSLSIPHLGFGTWNLSPSHHNASAAVSHAIQVGYRHIDGAWAYFNERAVGQGIAEGLKAAQLSRADIWVTSKLWNDKHDPRQVEAALDGTLADLGVGYLDLYLMHWPVAEFSNGTKTIAFVETWKAMAALPATGKVRHVGVSNFSPAQLRELIAQTGVVPFAHQMELHPYLPQTAWLLYHAEHGIHVTAYSPLGDSNPTYHPPSGRNVAPLLKNDVVVDIGAERGCTPAQVALAWGLSRGTSVIPKSKHAERIEENFEAAKCGLEYEDFERLSKLGMKPVRFNNPSGGWKVDLYEGLQDS